MHGAHVACCDAGATSPSQCKCPKDTYGDGTGCTACPSFQGVQGTTQAKGEHSMHLASTNAGQAVGARQCMLQAVWVTLLSHSGWVGCLLRSVMPGCTCAHGHARAQAQRGSNGHLHTACACQLPPAATLQRLAAAFWPTPMASLPVACAGTTAVVGCTCALEAELFQGTCRCAADKWYDPINTKCTVCPAGTTSDPNAAEIPSDPVTKCKCTATDQYLKSSPLPAVCAPCFTQTPVNVPAINTWTPGGVAGTVSADSLTVTGQGATTLTSPAIVVANNGACTVPLKFHVTFAWRFDTLEGGRSPVPFDDGMSITGYIDGVQQFLNVLSVFPGPVFASPVKFTTTVDFDLAVGASKSLQIVLAVTNAVDNLYPATGTLSNIVVVKV